METLRQLEDMRNPAVRAVSTRAPSVAMTMAAKPEPIRHTEAPAWVAEHHVAEAAGHRVAAVVAGTGS